jgi:hypothetical protein
MLIGNAGIRSPRQQRLSILQRDPLQQSFRQSARLLRGGDLGWRFLSPQDPDDFVADCVERFGAACIIADAMRRSVAGCDITGFLRLTTAIFDVGIQQTESPK